MSGRRGGEAGRGGRGDGGRGGAQSRGRGGRGRGRGDGGGISRGSGRGDSVSGSQYLSRQSPAFPAPLPPSSTSTTSTVASQLMNLSIDSAAPTPPSSSKALTPAGRPGFGTIGKEVLVTANHFLVTLDKPDAEIYHYDLTITPEVTSKRLNRDIVGKLVILYRDSRFGKRLPAYDGRKNIYTAGPLPFQSEDFFVKLNDDGSSGSKTKEREYKVSISFAAKLDYFRLLSFLQGQQLDCPHETIQSLDVVLRALASTKHVCVGRSFFSPYFGQPKPLANGVECWKGYYQSLRPSQLGLSFNVDLSATPFFEAIPVIDFISSYLGIKYLNRPMQEAERLKLKKALRGVNVETTHRPGMCRRYRVTGVSSMPAAHLMFEGPDGLQISVAGYFHQNYRFQLQFDKWPCLQCGSESRPTYLPIEVCKIVPGQRYTKKLNDKQVRELLFVTARRPQERLDAVKEMVTGNDYANDKFAKEFGIHIANNPTRVGAHLLPAPMLKYFNKNGRLQLCSPNRGSWNMIDKKMVNGGIVNCWGIMNFSKCDDNSVKIFCYELIKTCKRMGMKFTADHQIFSRSLPNNIDNALHDIVKRGKPLLQLLVVVLPDRSSSYGRIKKICETELGIVSQCCQPRNVMRYNPQYLENVALKINVKCGGRNTEIYDNRSCLPFVWDKTTIIFGADVTHPQPGEDSGPSIAAVVASMDWPEVSKYRCLVSAQKHRDEIISDLYTSRLGADGNVVHGGMIMDHLKAFYKETGLKPDRIIFYRDGVSEGQFNAVLLHEMDAIRKACAALQADYLPPITFVVVQKRHHTRLFPVGPQGSDKTGNILAGTVVDRGICHPTEFDFFLCSHAGIKGTSRPTHYHVLYDENGFSADAMQILTNNLCYIYARCTRSVSIVPPVYYAHLAAFRARYYLEESSEGGGSAAGSKGSGGGRAREAEVVDLPKIMDNVRNVMFYC